MDNSIEEIKRKIDIVEYIGSFITLKKAGRNFKAVCPFHNEKTPSFVISPERKIWHCFGACNEGGDVIKFLMKWENITFVEALKELAKKAGVSLKNISFEDKIWKKKERYLNMNLLTAEFYAFLLNKDKYGQKAKSYLDGRNIKQATIDKFQLGYAPQTWDSLRLFLKKKNYSDEEMFENGLLVKGAKGGYYDRFRGRLMFPIKDGRDFVIGFSGRNLNDVDKQAKYINSPETPVYRKRETLFGINLARESIRKEKNAYIVEGEFDVITPYQYGFTNFVAIKGTALTNEQLLLLKRFTDRVTLTLDVDVAGEQSTHRGIEEAERLDLEVKVARLSKGKDPDSSIREDINQFKKDITKTIPVYDYLIDSAQHRYPDGTSFSKKKIAEEVMPFIERITNPIIKSHYIKKMASVLEVSEESIGSMISLIKRKKKTEGVFKPKNKATTKEDRQTLIGKYLLSYIFQSEDPFLVFDRVFNQLQPKDFYLVSHQKIAEIFISFKKNEGRFNLDKFVSKLSSELRQVFDELYLLISINEPLKEDSLDRMIAEIKKFSILREIKLILESDESKSRKQELANLSKALKEVEKTLMS
ncbi:DNA primase [Patescibacteria group bacterium]|nr:DNA primase [Patescibacteria group bacterium]